MVGLKHLFKYGILSAMSIAIPSKFAVYTVLKFSSSRILKNRFFRILLDFSLPITSLKCPLPSIHVLIPTTEKDLGKLEAVIGSLKTYSSNPIERVFICSPMELDIDSFEHMGVQIEFLTDNQVLPKHIQDYLLTSIPSSRRGWTRQQVIKLLIGIDSKLPLLVFDADTKLLRKTTFVFPDGRQILQMSHEFHSPYEIHYQEFMATSVSAIRQANLSFVTHYQVFQSDLILKFLSSQNEDAAKRALVGWVDLADFSHDSPLSEYHCYGRYVSSFHSERVRIESWRNFDRRDKQDLTRLLQFVIRFRSKSNHLVG